MSEIYCHVCAHYFNSLGYMRHRTMHREEKEAPGYVHNGHCRHIRHKCSLCGSVRMERFMKPLDTKTRFGNQCWSCVDKKDDQHQRLIFHSY